MPTGPSSFDSSGASGQPAQPQEAAGPAGDRPVESSLLEQAVDETLALASSGPALPGLELAPYAEVARRYRGRPWTLEPVAADLALAVLRRRFGGAGLGETALADLARQTAQTLLDDPHARRRLEEFWKRLLESLA
jgi:hypothetical protein